MIARASFAFALALASMTAACGRGAKGDARALAAAVDRYRRAEGPDRAREERNVHGVACSDAEVCAAKAACAGAIDATAQALALKDEVSSRLDDIQAKRLDPGSQEARALPGKLDDAARLLREGRAKMETCDRSLAELSAKYGS